MKANNFFKMALLTGVFVMAVSCDKGDAYDPEEFIPPTPAEFKEVFENALKGITQTKTFKAEDGIDFTSEKGATFRVQPNSMYLEGNPVTGDVTFEFVELYKRGNMLVVNKPLMGTAEDGAKGPMITGGQFYINISQNGKDIDAYYNMTVPAENTGGLNTDMGLWTGKENEDGNMLWDEVDNRGQEVGGVFSEGDCYNIWGHLFKWINIDILYLLPDPKARVWVKVPEGFDNKNCSVYVIYRTQPGALAFFDVWDKDKKMFSEHYGLAPIGFRFDVVFISVQKDGKFIYSIKDETIEEGKIITFEQSDLKVLDKDALMTLINNIGNLE
jgi:hypothetical protein